MVHVWRYSHGRPYACVLFRMQSNTLKQGLFFQNETLAQAGPLSNFVRETNRDYSQTTWKSSIFIFNNELDQFVFSVFSP